MKSLPYYWYSSNKIVWLLLPLSWLYCFIITLRRWLYRINIKKSCQAAKPVVVIGNIVAGGSGKTPLLIALCDYIQAKGFNVGVVSRGYGGSLSGIKQLESHDLASVVGDEPLMISNATGAALVVGADRAGAVAQLLDNNACDVVFSDDGLQHYRMARDVEICVIDAERQFGNGFCLPAGPLREPLSRLQQTDLQVYSNAELTSAAPSYQLKIVGLRKLAESEIHPLQTLVGKTLHAVAGIGHPERFFASLRSSDIEIIEHAFSDHYQFSQNDFSGWQHDCIIMTEKDAVKCRHLELEDAWVLVVQAELNDALIKKLDELILPLLKTKTV